MKITEMNIPKQAFIYGAIHMLANRLQMVGDRIDTEVSSKQWFLLAIIAKFTEAPPNIGDVAQVLGTSRQNVKKMANILERQGFLKMEKDKNDLRSIQLFLTQKCRAYFKSREQQEVEYIERIFADMDDEMLTSLCSGMNKLVENINIILEDGKCETSA